MDKVVKAEISEILEEYYIKRHAEFCLNLIYDEVTNKALIHATSSLTALIIKWLEGKRVKVDGIEIDAETKASQNYEEELFNQGRNQLITELIGELR
jgi:hypothetical protein